MLKKANRQKLHIFFTNFVANKNMTQHNIFTKPIKKQ